ncbi:protease A [Myxococcus stipitatus DSM 14675]|uniref:Protease A n=1 Tax=Myxococcus stipitatus (strain DSM 14675 / JCM 12634 / Mx s8) TaxID=1278073 RepID=L7U6W6_MYXSD|nr:serine protease [Myxococcus stipitatus]AGC43848.1 protease A [Myxococcus stipitatus DSM 14675]
MTHKPLGSVITPWGLGLMGTALLGILACGKDAVPEDPPVCEESPRQAQVTGYLQCGATLDFTPVNSYRGEFADAVAQEDAVVLIGGSCTGTLIQASAGPVVLTAGHCVNRGDRPLIVFNHEESPDGPDLLTEGTVIEQALEPDYALIRLDVLPAITPIPLTLETSDRLAIIQHPRGRPKVVAEGRFAGACNRLVYYSDLDTLVGSSGAGVLNRRGHLLGVHTDGDCQENGRGTNRGWTSEVIVEASEYLVREDLVGP